MGILERLRLDGKSAFVTGGARGIGKSIAIALAEAGANVAIVDVDIETSEKTAEEIARLGVKTISVKTDVTDEAQVELMANQVVSAFGKLDIAFCNAGICINTPAAEMTLEEWKKVMDVNLTGVFLTARAAGRMMIAQGGGSIINTASMSGHIVNYPQPQCAYNASKAAVIQLTKSMAVEWAQKNVRVNSISPGYICTDLVLNAPHLTPLIEQWEAATPVRRMGRPDELQAIAIFLAGDSSAFTTGADFVIDGAFTCV
ncbi:MAG: SDR family oxidoreductase [Clostridiales bacterium]|jgi:NAD(P)-dependent dehydrogenase (short-subunit alcohol dehydrogenase family)|nr:SDR family oxidoreductase [Clostridiales bacterium]